MEVELLLRKYKDDITETKFGIDTNKLQSIKEKDDITETKFGIDSNGQVPDTKSSDCDTSDDEANEENAQAKKRNIVCIAKRIIHTSYKKHENVALYAVKLAILLLFLAYFSYAMYVRFGDDGSIRLLAMTALILFYIAIKTSRKYTDKLLKNISQVSSDGWKRAVKIIRWCLYVGMSIFIVTYIIVDVAFAGIVLILVIFYLTSKHPERVNGHIVCWGMALQFILALLILRTSWGISSIKYIGDNFAEFTTHANAGAILYFGEDFLSHGMAFLLTAVIVFLCSVIAILEYLGAMRVIVSLLGRSLAFCTGASPAEAICATTSIFLGPEFGPLMIRSLLKDLTNSELHAIMSSGFACMDVSLIAYLITLGISGSHLLSASVMSAPAALAIAKLSYPERKKSKATNDVYNRPPSTDRNIFDAASNGAMAALAVIGCISVNLIAFVSLLSFIDATLGWFGDRINIELSMEVIFSYLFYPIAYFIGIALVDCATVGRLLGIKMFVGEIIAYQKMSVLMKNEHAYLNYTETYNTSHAVEAGKDIFLPLLNQTLVGGIIQERSAVIATYALCSLSSLGDLGVMLGIMGGLAPTRRKDFSRMVLRAMIVGNVASFLTAAIAGLIYKEFE